MKFSPRLFATLFALFWRATIIAQTGPGGVGDDTDNILWLEADEITGIADGNAITTWSDGSGNNNDVSQNSASFKPIFKTNILNGYPAVRFNTSNGRIRKNGFTDFGTTAVTAIYVNTNAENGEGVLSYASTGNNNDFLLFNSSSLRVYRSNANRNSGISLNDNTWHITNAGWRSSDGRTEVWKDGTLGYSTTGLKTGTSITAGGCLAIAGEQDAVDGSYQASQSHSGDFTEVIVFSSFLNTAQHIIINNYLAAKYNLAIADDYFAYETTHSYDVAGIGREDASNTHTAAMSADILQIENASNLDAAIEYLLFGHDNADATSSWTTTEAPNGGTDIERLAREWRLSETGDVGTVDIKVDVNDLPALPTGHTMYALLVDSDGDFSNGASVYEMTLSSGTEYIVTGIDINHGDYLAIAAVDPKVEHTLTNSVGFEPNNATIQVELNFIPRTAKTVDYTTTDGTALSAQPDYTGVAGGTVTIPAGSMSANYTVAITNDVVVENNETFTIALSNPSAGISVGTNVNHTYTISDDDNSRKVYFDLSSASGDESVSSVTVTLSINNADGVNTTAVDYIISGGTATDSGTDYTLAAGTASFAPGITSSSFTFTVTDDLLYESNETVIIDLSNPSNCNIDGIAPFGGTGFISHTYTINDNDAPPTIQFNSSSSSGDESISSVDFQVDLNTSSGVDASANYTITGTATGTGTDYTLANGAITIPAGSTTENITAVIIDDAIAELSETIIITLSGATDATIGANTVYTYTIIDNDQIGYLGPGGVGDDASNVLWVKSDDIPVVADGTDITSWADASGNSHTLTQANTSRTPRYYSNILNGHPVVRFEQSNNRLIHNSFSDFPTSAITTFAVNRNSDSGEGMLSYASSSSDNDYLWFSSNSMTIYRGGSNNNTGTAVNGNTWRILANTWQSSDGANVFYRNGTQTYSGTLASGSTISSGGNLAIGGEQDGVNSGYNSSQAHQGDFSEIILFNVVLNSAQRKIIENYLSAKFNIATANDLYSYDAPGNYNNDLIGIGRDNSSNFHLDAQGTGIVRINNASSLDDGDFLLLGHDGADYNNGPPLIPWTSTPTGVDNSLQRVWRVDETGDVGTVSVSFDMSAFTIGNSSDLILMMDNDDGDFTNASITAISSYAGGIARFDNVDFTAGAWFTIGSLSSANPLPIELISFEAHANKDRVELTWVTASETHNDYFTIERSGNGKDWEAILTIEGVGDNLGEMEYFDIDYEPLTGVSYYRLKQTDFDNRYTYSNIVPVEIRKEATQQTSMRIFPNPWNQQSPITVQLDGFSGKEVVVVLRDITGKVFYAKVILADQDNKLVAIDPLGNIPAGTYLITGSSDNSIYSKQVIIQQ